MLWKADLDIQILTVNRNFIDAIISFKDSTFHGTFIYGAPEICNRQEVWNQLIDLSLTRHSPWFLTGDFNDIICNNEKSGGTVRPESSFTSFRSFLSTCDLFDIKHSGNFLSWRGQRHSHLVHCRLDRAVANSSWSDLFPRARCEYLKFEASDHRPLVTTLDVKKRKHTRLFRYDRRLRDNPEISKLVEDVWKDQSDASVADRIRRVRQAISTWSKENYVNSRKLILELKEALDNALSVSVPDETAISHLNQRLLKAYRAEEEFWKQRSCLMWLSLGDKNTTFFHASSKGRKARNRISVLEDSSGSPVFEDSQIVELISSYFKISLPPRVSRRGKSSCPLSPHVYLLRQIPS